MAVTPGTTSSQSGVQLSFGTAVPAGTTIQLADSGGNVVATFVTAKRTASLVFSSAAITAGEDYTVYTGGTASVTAGLGDGTLDGGAAAGHRDRRRVHGGAWPRRPLARTRGAAPAGAAPAQPPGNP